LLTAGYNDELNEKKPRYAEDNLYAAVNPKPQVIIIKDSTRVIILLRLTIDGHKASRGLSAAGELLVQYWD